MPIVLLNMGDVSDRPVYSPMEKVIARGHTFSLPPSCAILKPGPSTRESLKHPFLLVLCSSNGSGSIVTDNHTACRFLENPFLALLGNYLNLSKGESTKTPHS